MKSRKKGRFFPIKSKFLGVLFLVSVASAILLFSSASFVDEEQPFEAPKNPEFIKYLEMKEKGLWRTFTSEGYPLGHIPELLDIDYIYDLTDQSSIEIDTLPKKFDWRKKSNKLSKVKNQGSCGSCWGFATYGALESACGLPSKNKSFVFPFMPDQKNNWDFSEQHLIENHGFQSGECDGGNLTMSMAYLTRRCVNRGPIDEKKMPYEYAFDANPAKYPVIKHLQNAYYAPVRTSSTDNNKIKQLVQKYGAAYVSYYHSSSRYNSTYYSYYNPSDQVGGHAVCIIGWDDNFSKNKFNTTPAGNGAFIVRNSWGSSWGDKGYYYVSYYDKYFARRSFSAVFPKPETKTNYKDCYEYDPSGWISSLGYGDSTAWGANIFKATSNRSLRAVSSYFAGNTNKYTVYIYKNVKKNKPRSGTLVTKKSGKFTRPGYYTIKLPKKVPLTKGKRFSAVIKYTTTGYNYPIPCERQLTGFTVEVTSKKGESFYSHYGTSWNDFYTTGWKNYNACIKGFAK